MFQIGLGAILPLVISTEEILLLNTTNVRGYPPDHANFNVPKLLQKVLAVYLFSQPSLIRQFKQQSIPVCRPVSGGYSAVALPK